MKTKSDWPTESKLYEVAFIGWGDSDWMGKVIEDETGKVKVMHRLRIYNPVDRPNDAWDGADFKLWKISTKELTLEQATKGLAGIAARLILTRMLALGDAPEIIDHVEEPTGDPERMANEMKTRDWCHVKEFSSKEDADRWLAGRRPS